ncbi:hypothetical protein A5658_04715 [Mycobacterium sp. 1245111.1]|uniref:hypothetical protein n=1 Tax=Mycobacterium sp. 1245111.1 TaxID=1834073 RepID=UPI000800579F|nr:hypothetical protein [Mycobacterium sp. 1245111.1]OBK36966.1 hypothetical protein A5658_04715 [Mycobacterium sp. 1245111.1]
MSLYRCTIAHDGDRRQIIVHWDDDNPNRAICSPVTVPAAELDEARLIHELGRSGFRLVSADSDNIGRGWAIVARSQTDRPFYNPIDQTWHTYLTDDAKRDIAATWPDAAVPGAR